MPVCNESVCESELSSQERVCYALLTLRVLVSLVSALAEERRLRSVFTSVSFARRLYCYSQLWLRLDGSKLTIALEETDAAAALQACNLRCKLCGIFRCTNLPQKEAGF